MSDASEWANKRRIAIERAKQIRDERKSGVVDASYTFTPQVNKKPTYLNQKSQADALDNLTAGYANPNNKDIFERPLPGKKSYILDENESIPSPNSDALGREMKKFPINSKPDQNRDPPMQNKNISRANNNLPNNTRGNMRRNVEGEAAMDSESSFVNMLRTDEAPVASGRRKNAPSWNSDTNTDDVVAVAPKPGRRQRPVEMDGNFNDNGVSQAQNNNAGRPPVQSRMNNSQDFNSNPRVSPRAPMNIPENSEPQAKSRLSLLKSKIRRSESSSSSRSDKNRGVQPSHDGEGPLPDYQYGNHPMTAPDSNNNVYNNNSYNSNNSGGSRQNGMNENDPYAYQYQPRAAVRNVAKPSTNKRMENDGYSEQYDNSNFDYSANNQYNDRNDRNNKGSKKAISKPNNGFDGYQENNQFVAGNGSNFNNNIKNNKNQNQFQNQPNNGSQRNPRDVNNDNFSSNFESYENSNSNINSRNASNVRNSKNKVSFSSQYEDENEEEMPSRANPPRRSTEQYPSNSGYSSSVSQSQAQTQSMESEYPSNFDQENGEDDENGEPGELIQCPDCQRRFNSRAFEKHSKICAKVFLQKRKIFDSKKMRIQDNEELVKILSKSEKEEKMKARQAASAMKKNSNVVDRQAVPVAAGGGTAAAAAGGGGGDKSSTWKAQSQAFREAMRNARKVSEALKTGGPLPPPTISAPDPSLIQCPHCQRRFNQTAAERHIPICNKIQAKPTSLKKGSGGGGGISGGPTGMNGSNFSGKRRAGK